MEHRLRYKLKKINIPEEWFFCNPFKNYNKKIKSYLISLNEYKSDTIIYITIFARGLLNHLNTIIYLEDKNFYEKDTFYKVLPIERRKFMLARLERFTNNIKYYEHDLYLSGINEAVFFNYDN